MLCNPAKAKAEEKAKKHRKTDGPKLNQP